MEGIGNGNGKGNRSPRRNKEMARRDRPLPSTLPADLKPYDTNNDGVLDAKERLAMKIAKERAAEKERQSALKMKKNKVIQRKRNER